MGILGGRNSTAGTNTKTREATTVWGRGRWWVGGGEETAGRGGVPVGRLCVVSPGAQTRSCAVVESPKGLAEE